MVLTVLGVGAVVGTVAVAVLVVASLGSLNEVAGDTSATAVSEVRVDVPMGGEVTVLGDADRDTVEAQWSLDTIGTGDVTSDTRDEALDIEVECPPGPLVWVCTADLTVLVPAGTDLDIAVGSGAVLVADVAGDVEVEIDRGDVTLGGLRSRTVDVGIESGRIDVDLAAPPQEVVATAEFGDISVRVPDDGTAYDVTATAEFGSDSTSVAPDPDAERSITATTEFGDVEVRPSRP